jgi:hypothetical protein
MVTCTCAGSNQLKVPGWRVTLKIVFDQVFHKSSFLHTWQINEVACCQPDSRFIHYRQAPNDRVQDFVGWGTLCFPFYSNWETCWTGHTVLSCLITGRRVGVDSTFQGVVCLLA